MNESIERKVKKEKSKINYINVGCGVIGLVLITALVGINYKVTKENNFTRIVNENGDYELEGYISYDNLKEYDVVEMETITGDTKVFIGKLKTSVYGYKDIISDEIIYDYDNIISVTNIDSFLFAYDMMKGKYSEDDILELLDRIKDDYKNNENSKLVKQQ